jgi:hypothetical protein
VAVPSPLSVKVTPPGKDPLSLKEGGGKPDVVTVKVPAEAMVKEALFALMMEGAEEPLPVRANVWGLFEALSTSVRVATRAPDAIGVKVTLIVHVA